MLTTAVEHAFPHLTAEEISLLEPLSRCQDFEDGEFVFRAGDEDGDLFVVKAGLLDVLNPSDGDRVICTHEPGQFSGDIDLIIRRPPIVSGVARGRTKVLRVAGERLREVLTRIPRLSEKLLSAFQTRRQLLSQCNKVGLRVVGYPRCNATTILREFLYKSFMPFNWYDPDSEEGKATLVAMGSPAALPAVECPGRGVLVRPTLRELATAAGMWHHCPSQTIDLAVIGAGPAGLAAAVYAASEGVNTLVLDGLGPGGQAGGSSKIENFIGFPSGLSGAELAMRGVLQMVKFGAKLIAPARVESIEAASSPGEYHSLILDCGAAIRARVVLIATGVRWRKLEAENAARFDRAGVYYACTSVEALLHDGEDVAVVGAGNSAGQAAMYLAECCAGRTVHLIARGRLGPNMSNYLRMRIESAPNIRVHERTQITAVNGRSNIESVDLVTVKAERSVLGVGAVFVFIGAEPGAEWLPDAMRRDDKGFVLTGADAVDSGHWPLKERSPCPLETTVPGLLAAGDIRSGSTKRVGFAVGDGSLAVACVHRLLAQL